MPARSFFISCAVMAGSLLLAQTASAGSHTWRLTEAFSNADGTIQFIELSEPSSASGEGFLAGHTLTSNTHTFTFPANLVGSTANKHLLLATSGFAALPGAPTPDYIIVNSFFTPAGDTIHYHVYDTWTFSFAPDCVNSLHRDPLPPNTTSIAPNNPVNFAGATGQINACPAPPCPANIVNTGTSANSVDVDDLLAVISSWGPCPAPPAACPANIVTTGGSATQVDVDDLLAVISGWGPCQ